MSAHEKALVDALFEHGLSAAQWDQLFPHMRTCEDCRTYFASVRADHRSKSSKLGLTEQEHGAVLGVLQERIQHHLAQQRQKAVSDDLETAQTEYGQAALRVLRTPARPRFERPSTWTTAVALAALADALLVGVLTAVRPTSKLALSTPPLEGEEQMRQAPVGGRPKQPAKSSDGEVRTRGGQDHGSWDALASVSMFCVPAEGEPQEVFGRPVRCKAGSSLALNVLPPPAGIAKFVSLVAIAEDGSVSRVDTQELTSTQAVLVGPVIAGEGSYRVFILWFEKEPEPTVFDRSAKALQSVGFGEVPSLAVESADAEVSFRLMATRR